MKTPHLAYLLVALLTLLVGVAAFADAWLDQNTWETMTAEKEAHFIRDWDNSWSKGLASGPGMLLGQLIEPGNQQASRFMRLRYNNNAIVSRMVKLYIAECQYKGIKDDGSESPHSGRRNAGMFPSPATRV